MSECTHDCSTCASNCSDRQGEPIIEKEKLNEYSSVKKVIGVVSGKGGVGKSLITSLLAVEMSKKGKRCAVLDADITGPSITKTFGITQKAQSTETALIPAFSKTGIQIMSTNMLLPEDTDPVVWRGPVVAGIVKQFWTDVIWDDVDFMFVDMPPGTRDVPLTVFQSLPVDGIVIVTSPQDLVSMVVEKAVKMANMMNVPIVGLVENYSWLECPDCGKKINAFGESKANEVAAKYGLEVLAQIPINTQFASACDKGQIEDFSGSLLEKAIEKIEKL